MSRCRICGEEHDGLCLEGDVDALDIFLGVRDSMFDKYGIDINYDSDDEELMK